MTPINADADMGRGKEIYVGDGLYLNDDGYQIVLRAPREDGDHYVYMEPTVFANVVMQGFRIMSAEVFSKILEKSAEHIRKMQTKS